jgi:hypothetical protein
LGGIRYTLYLLAVGAAAVVAATASATSSSQSEFYYTGPAPVWTCTNVSFPQANWFNSRHGMLNAIPLQTARNIMAAGNVFYVGYVANGQVDVGYNQGSEPPMHVGEPSLDPWDKAKRNGPPYYAVETYRLFEGSCGDYSASCPTYLIIDSRGSGTTGGSVSPPGMALAYALHKMVWGAATVEILSNDYPAVGIIPTLEEILRSLSLNPSGGAAEIAAIRDALNGVGALARISRIGAYHDSVLRGEDDLRQRITSAIQTCGSSGTTFGLTGYSQGAQVTADVYQSLPIAQRRRIALVVLFGDPRYNHSSFADIYKRDNNGILPVRGEFPADTRGKVLSYCHARDPICQGLGQFALHLTGAHNTYAKLDEPKRAARYFLPHK